MKTIMIILIAFYFIIGILVYAFTDTRKFAGKLERISAFLTFSDIIKHSFPFVVVLWPVWLFINAKFND
jgi:hypothetical protein